MAADSSGSAGHFAYIDDVNERGREGNLLALLERVFELEVDSERRLSRPISRVLGSLRSRQLTEQRIVDGRHRRRKVGVV